MEGSKDSIYSGKAGGFGILFPERISRYSESSRINEISERIMKRRKQSILMIKTSTADAIQSILQNGPLNSVCSTIYILKNSFESSPILSLEKPKAKNRIKKLAKLFYIHRYD